MKTEFVFKRPVCFAAIQKKQAEGL